MRIGFAAPISLRLMQDLVEQGDQLPAGYEFAPAVDWVKHLLRNGHSVTVYTTAKDIAESTAFTGPGLTLRIAKSRASGCGRDLFREERAVLSRMMIADQCDVIHAHWTYEFALAALHSGRPTLVTVHDLPWNVLRYFRDGHRLAKVLLAYRTALQGRRFTAVSHDAARHFRHYFAPWARVDVIPNGLPDTVFQMTDAAPRVLGEGFTFATNLQGWSARKNASVALQAFAAVRMQLPQSKLLMFGKDYQPGGMAEQWAAQRQLTADVTFIGQLGYADLLRRMSTHVDVLVHPSLDESFSMASLEAMALRKPVIAGSQTPGVREVLGYGSAGALVDVSCMDLLANTMLRLATDQAERTHMTNAGFERAYRVYRLEAVVSMYEELYRQVQKEGHNPSSSYSTADKRLTARDVQGSHVD